MDLSRLYVPGDELGLVEPLPVHLPEQAVFRVGRQACGPVQEIAIESLDERLTIVEPPAAAIRP